MDIKQEQKIKDFISYWKTAEGNEINLTQRFWLDLADILGVESPNRTLEFERAVENRRIDVF